eukprot:1024898_1
MEIKITRTATPEPLTQFEREKLRDQLFQSGVLRWVEEKETYCNYFEEMGRIESDVDRKEMKKKVNNEQEIPQRIASKAVAPEVVNALKEAHEAAEKAVAAEEEAVPAIAVCAEQREKEIAKRMWACEPVSYDVVSIKKVEKEYDLDHAKAMWACEPVSYDVVSIKKVEKEYDIDHAKVSEMNGDMQAYLEADPVKNEEGTVVESICCGSLFDEPKKAEESRNASTQNDAYSETNDNKGASNLRTELLDNPRRVCTFDPGAQCKDERSALLMAESRATRDKWCVFINKSLGKDNDKDVEEAASSSGAFPNNGGSMKLVNDEIDLKKQTRPSAFSHGFIVSRIPDDDGFDDGIDSRRDDPVYKDRMQVLSDISVIPSMDSCSVVGTIFRLDEDESDEEESLIFDPGGLLADSSYHGMTQENEDLTDDALFETDFEKKDSDYDYVDGMYQYRLCVATSDPEDSISCEYVNFDGIAQRIYVRHEETFEGTELIYQLECDEDIQGDTRPVVHRWYLDDPCKGTAVHTEYFVSEDIVDYVCHSSRTKQHRCADDEVFLFKYYHKIQCADTEFNCNEYNDTMEEDVLRLNREKLKDIEENFFEDLASVRSTHSLCDWVKNTSSDVTLCRVRCRPLGVILTYIELIQAFEISRCILISKRATCTLEFIRLIATFDEQLLEISSGTRHGFYDDALNCMQALDKHPIDNEKGVNNEEDLARQSLTELRSECAEIGSIIRI